MRFVLARTSQPSVEPVTLAEAKVQVRAYADQTDEDAMITALILAAREWVEDYTGRALVEQRWALSVDTRVNVPGQSINPLPAPGNGYGWYSGEMQNSLSGWLLHKSPVISIAEFVSIADDGTESAVSAATYRLADGDSKWPTIAPIPTGGSWGVGVFRVGYRAGYAAGVGSPDPSPDVDDVPQRYKQAILLHVEAHYDRDERMMMKLLEAAENLIRPERSDMSLA